MRLLWMVVIVAATAACAQTEWRHERLLETKTFSPINAFVSAGGIATYTAWAPPLYLMDVYKGGVNLSGKVLDFPHQAQNSGGGINDSDQVAWHGIDLKGGDYVFVDERNWSVPIYGPTTKLYTHIEGVDNLGRPFWYAVPEETRRLDVYLGSERLTADMTSPWLVWLEEVNRNGDAVWVGGSDETGNELVVFKNGRNISSGHLGDRAEASHGAVNDLGQVAWTGRGSATDHYWDVFVDDFNLSRSILGDGWRSALLGDINNNGQVFWKSGSLVYVGDVELTAGIPSDIRQGLRLNAFSESGDAVWSTVFLEPVIRPVLFWNSTNISDPALGEDPVLKEVRGMDDFGHVLWGGLGANTGGVEQVFVDTFNLSRDLLGPDAPRSIAMAIGPNGHVLWASLNPGPVTWDIWLSTPIPEPSVLLLAAPLLLTLRRRK